MTSTERSWPRPSRTRVSRSTSDAFVAFAALTVGMLDTALGRDDTARGFLLEADELGTRFGNRWLTSSARTQLAILDVRSGARGAARDYLRRCLDEIDDQVGTIIACFMLTAFAELAVAEAKPREAATALGAVEGCASAPGSSPGRSPAGRRPSSGLGSPSSSLRMRGAAHTTSAPTCARATRSTSSGAASPDQGRSGHGLDACTQNVTHQPLTFVERVLSGRAADAHPQHCSSETTTLTESTLDDPFSSTHRAFERRPSRPTPDRNRVIVRIVRHVIQWHLHHTSRSSCLTESVRP